MATRLDVLIVSAELETCRTLANVLSQWGLEPICCSTVSQATEVLSQHAISLVFCDDHLPDGSFRDVLNAANSAVSKTRVVVTTRNGCRSEAFSMGAFNVISCPCRGTDVRQTIFHAVQDVNSATMHQQAS